MPELYDWQADTRWSNTGSSSREDGLVHHPASPSVERVNRVNGHGSGCECPQCPGWYVARERARVPSSGPHVPPPVAARPLTDQVIPVCCLLATVAVCGLVLVPVVVPVLAVGLTALVVALVVLAVTVVGVLAVLGRASARREATRGAAVIHGEVTRRRRGWR